MEVRIKANNISKIYAYNVSHGLFRRTKKEKIAVNNISLSVKAGEIHGLIGPNGSGKTTTIKLISGLMYCPEGEIFVDGEDPYKKTISYRRKASVFLGTKGRLDVDLSIYEMVMLYARLYDIEQQQAQQHLRDMQMMLHLEDELIHKQVRTLSLGQRMKGEICLSFIHKPEIIFLDEPTIGLDSKVAKNIRAYLKEYVTQHGAAMILTSHNFRDIEETCQNITVLNHGNQVYSGALDDLPTFLEHHVTLQFDLQDTNLYPFIHNDFPSARIDGHKVTMDVLESELDIILNRLYKIGFISNLKITQASLESLVEEISNV